MITWTRGALGPNGDNLKEYSFQYLGVIDHPPSTSFHDKPSQLITLELNETTVP